MLSLFRRKPSGGAYRLPCGRYADALAAYKVLLRGGVNRLLDECAASDATKAATAETAVCELARRAFGLKPVDPRTGVGYADADCLDLLDAFFEWLGAKKATPQSSPTSAAPTDSPPAASPPTSSSACC